MIMMMTTTTGDDDDENNNSDNDHDHFRVLAMPKESPMAQIWHTGQSGQVVFRIPHRCMFSWDFPELPSTFNTQSMEKMVG